MPVHFVTPGALELDNALTFGVSAKETDSPIGQFGTGLKYALAVLLRTNHEIDIYIDGMRCPVTTESMSMRGKHFEKVAVGDMLTSFTTDLGKHWDVWMAYRELHSNVIDESGKTFYDASSRPNYIEYAGHTVISVSGDGIEQCWVDRSDVFCDGPVLDETPEIKIRAGSSRYLFYKGVRVHELPAPSVYTYDIKARQELTEDRSLMYCWEVEQKLANYIARSTNQDIIERILVCHAAEGRYYEEKLVYSQVSSPSEQFIAALTRVCSDRFCNKSAYMFAHTLDIVSEDEECGLNSVEIQQLNRAKHFLKDAGYMVDEYPIRVVDLPGGTLARAQRGTIFLSPRLFNMGTKYVALALFEEWTHLKTGYRDETRQMQTHLFETIMSLIERIKGEPV